MKTALITGVAEEGGSYLVELLLSQGYIVHGLKNNYQIVHASSVTDSSLELINKRYKLHFCDFSNLINLLHMIQETQPDEIYNLAALNHVKLDLDNSKTTIDSEGISTLRILELVKILGLTKKTKIFQASSYELYGMITG